jgi:hypothetical protein
VSIVLTAGLVVLAILATAVVVYVYPASFTSVLRYRLWPIRDELTDALRRDEFKDRTQAERLQRDVEASIETADEFRPLRMGLVMILARGRKPPIDWPPFDLEAAAEQDRPRLAALHRAYMSAMLRRILFGSWSGLFVFALASAAAFVMVILKGRPKTGGSPDGSVVEEVKEVVRREIEVEPTLRVLAGRPARSQSLSASV